MAVLDEILIRLRTIGGAAAGAEVRGAEGAIGGLGKTAKFAAGLAGVGGLALTLKDSAEAAIRFQDVNAGLANALHNVGQYSKANVQHIDAAAESMAVHGGAGAEQNIQGIQMFIRANVGVTEAIKDQTLATDISLATGRKAQMVQKALLMVEQGRTTGLARMGIVIKPVTDAMDRLHAAHVKITPEMKKVAQAQDEQATKTKALTTLWQRFSGAMAAHSKTAAGAASNLKNQLNILMVHLGTALLPTITKFLLLLNKVVLFFEHNRTAAKALGIALGSLAAMWVVTRIASAGAMGPWTLAIAAVTFGVIELVKHWKEVVHWLLEARHWLIDHQWVLAITAMLNPFMAVIALIAFMAIHFKEVKDVAVTTFKVLKTMWLDLIKVLVTSFNVWKAVAVFVFDHILKPGFNAVKSVAVTAFNIIRPIAVGVFKAIEIAAKIGFALLRLGFAATKKMAEVAFKGISWVVSNVLAPVFNTVALPAIHAVVDVFNHLWNDVLKPFGTFLSGAWSAIWSTFKGAWHDFKDVVNHVADAFGHVFGALKDIGNWVITTGQKVLDFINQLGSQDVVPTPGGIAAAHPGGSTAGLTPHAYGGTQRRAGWATVGEHGTERVFLPGGATVQPYTGAGSPGLEGQLFEVHSHLSIGNREFAHAIGYSQAKLKATS